MDDCCICNESLPKLDIKFTRMTCCGKGIHTKCFAGIESSSLSDTQKGQCLMCRTKRPAKGSKEAIEQICRWMEKGKAWAQNMLGERYRDGVGVDQSYQQAAELFELSATQGNAIAQFNLGALYANGDGVEQSFETARGWMMKAAEQGHEDAIKGLQQLDKYEGRTTPSFTPPKRCFTCDTPETPSHKLNDCPCFGAQYCNAKNSLSHHTATGARISPLYFLFSLLSSTWLGKIWVKGGSISLTFDKVSPSRSM